MPGPTNREHRKRIGVKTISLGTNYSVVSTVWSAASITSYREDCASAAEPAGFPRLTTMTGGCVEHERITLLLFRMTSNQIIRSLFRTRLDRSCYRITFLRVFPTILA